MLRGLGFEVTGGSEPAGGVWREHAEVGGAVAVNEWARAARDVLLEAALRYHSTVTYAELARAVQQRAGVRARQLVQHWIGAVLAEVAVECGRRGEPNLSALCVNSTGSVGTGYAEATARNWPPIVGDADEHAAEVRLQCHRYFGASDLPADGGRPALTTTLASSRSRERKAAQSDRPVAVCPTCAMALPRTCICDDCD